MVTSGSLSVLFLRAICLFSLVSGYCLVLFSLSVPVCLLILVRIRTSGVQRTRIHRRLDISSNLCLFAPFLVWAVNSKSACEEVLRGGGEESVGVERCVSCMVR